MPNPVVLTSDNPRTENPEQIFADMKQGIHFSEHNVHEIHDRREAIGLWSPKPQAGDIVVIAGKGHENYQEVDGVRHWFDDGSRYSLRLMHKPIQSIQLILRNKVKR